ncbi:Demethylrebeccamycin-D-glucose O-methyltransferase [compost metagenome]
MIKSATDSAQRSGNTDRVSFRLGDSQALPFSDNSFDAVINECAVGIPDDSQQVLNEKVRVVKSGGTVVIHESIWKKRISDMEKEELSERYGTTPLEPEEWKRIPGLYYVGLSNQRSFASATVRGVGPDAKYVVRKIKRFLKR